MPQQISVRIDNELYAATEGQTILQVAADNNRSIPTLCYLEGLSAPGSCRLCLVEVAGVGRLLPACTTPARSGMSVTTNSDALAHNRLMALELLFIERNHVCSVCVSNGHCELQSMAQELGMTHVHLPYNFPRLPVDMSHPRFVLDHNRCILCSRCVRVCDEIEGAQVWDISRAASTPCWSPNSIGHGARRRPAPVAASACRSVQPALWWRRARQSRK